MNLDDKLTCPICQETFLDAIETACGHVCSFCDLLNYIFIDVCIKRPSVNIA